MQVEGLAFCPGTVSAAGSHVELRMKIEEDTTVNENKQSRKTIKPTKSSISLIIYTSDS